jgi:shikimate kinase
MKIFLVGYMGSGKSTLGKRLANALEIPFLDTDTEIERIQGKSISAIFQDEGEEHFRQLEEKYLISLKDVHERTVYATGGGMPCFYDNITLLNELGATVYLKRPASELLHRLVNSKKERPLTVGKTKEELYKFIDQHLSEREPFYEKAKIIAPRSKQDVPSLLELIHQFEKNQL